MSAFLLFKYIFTALLFVLSSSLFAQATRNDLDVRHREPQGAVQATPQHVIIAGGFDGRVFALDAWTGAMLWMFNSGGPLVEFSNCDIPPTSPPNTDTNDLHPRSPPTSTIPSASVTVHVAEDGELLTSTGISSASNERLLLPQLFPAYNGRLFHLGRLTREAQELEMTMVDIVNANGPVRVVQESLKAGDEFADVVLVGDKQTKLFHLDLLHGVVQPFMTHANPTTHVLFGRSEYHTKAVHVRNATATQCFTIAEYFLQFSDHPRCEKVSTKSQSESQYGLSPKLVVVPPRRHARDDSDMEESGQEGSIIAAFHPLTDEPLWEFEEEALEVSAVYGVTPSRDAPFFQWKTDGPSTSTKRHSASLQRTSSPGPSSVLPLLPGQETDPHGLALSENANQMARVVPIAWRELKSQFRMRQTQGHYYIESSEDELSPFHIPFDEDDDSEASPYLNQRNDPSHFTSTSRSRRRRPIFWESMESNGKKGVFLTYQHVGAITLGVTLSCVFIAWGCYLRGMSAKFAPSMLQQLDTDHFFAPHQLTIERPGGQKISISIRVNPNDTSSPAIMPPRDLPLLLNDDDDDENNTQLVADERNQSLEVRLDPETEALLLEKFSQLITPTRPALTDGSTAADLFKSPRRVERERGAVAASSPMEIELMSDLSEHDQRISQGSSTWSAHTREDVSVEEIDSWSSSVRRYNLAEKTRRDDSDSKRNSSTKVTTKQSTEVDIISWSSESTGTSEKSNESERDESNSAGSADDVTESKASTVSERKKSDASTSSSNNNEVEAIFPYVCQSRFANEFVEISPIGKGGFGQVILAENRLDGRKYAIKRVGLNLRNQTSKTLQKFLREVKILALLDHPNIVRYYQAWLEKVDGSTDGSNSIRITSIPVVKDSLGDDAPPRNYSTSNLLAPVSELEFTNDRGRRLSYLGDSLIDDGEDDGFEWERNSSDELENEQVWKEEDLVVQNHKPSLPSRRQSGKKRLSVVVSNSSLKDEGPLDDSANSGAEKCDHWLYIQMQYCAGRNLGDFLSLPNRPRELPKLLKVFTQIASALAHVHSCGLIHRDLKPANIFVADTDGDSIKLGDFGLSRYAANVNVNVAAAVANNVVEEQVSSVHLTRFQGLHGPLSSSHWSKSMSTMSESGEVTAGVGTYLYASPEQVAGKKYNARTDMYSLGMILFEMCHEPFATTMERYITLRNARDCIFPADFVWWNQCPELMEMLEKLLHQDAMLRPTAEDVVQWCQELYESTLAHQMLHVLRSPVHHSKPFNGGTMPSLSIDTATHHTSVGGPDSTCFLLQVEAKMDGGNALNHASGDMGERRLPNHNLLKEICDVVEEVSDGHVEIKRCGLHFQNEGVQVLEFVLDVHDQRQLGDQIVGAINALSTVQTLTFHPTHL